jgi:hypothetical protein
MTLSLFVIKEKPANENQFYNSNPYKDIKLNDNATCSNELNENYDTNYHEESVVFNDSTENNGAPNHETVVFNANYLTGKI